MTIDDLLRKWLGREGGAERANYQMFLTELTQALGLPSPDPKGVGLGDYQFEAPVKSMVALGRKGTGRIDLYKRDAFILEAKQSRMTGDEPVEFALPDPPPQPIYDLFGAVIGYEPSPARKLGRYDTLMADARIQAERYAQALPGDHRSPPFLIVADIGRSFELYFDWAGNGRGYGPFPNERSYRIGLEALASGDPVDTLKLSAAEVLRAIWTKPASIDPRLRAAEVTREIAQRLSRVAAQLEKDERARNPGAVEIAMGIEATSLFLMRMLFCMFAEDVELLPKDSFKTFLADARDRSDQFWRTGLTDLWSRMNQPEQANRYWSQGDAFVRYFNGNLFSGVKVYNVPSEFKRELLEAAGKDWRAVEPAIFGTLLEQVLTASDRARLGAHYTPRAYVERLVQATILDVLVPEWEAVLAGARSKADAGDRAGAIADAGAFHDRLAATRVLDPACGTGNFLYVAMEQLLRLEGEVRGFVAGLDGSLSPRIGPNQFLGLELNPRAAVIAELVLWIGWLRYRLANTPEAIGEPVLPPLSNINGGTHGGVDAVLVRTATGEPDTANPRRPEWPEADFIVGNPPFIGGQDVREKLGANYAAALWQANPRVAKSADFVMHWWDRAADILTRDGTRLRRFGLVTTNSITQVFSRRVIQTWLAATADDDDIPARKLHLTLAIPDHPWTRVTKDAAAVRIAMTVAEAGVGTGALIRITGERAIDTDAPELSEQRHIGRINADLSVGTDATRIVALRANEGLCHDGVKLHGRGFSITRSLAESLGLGRRPGLDAHIRPYRNGRDLAGRTASDVASKVIIDLFGLSEAEVSDRYPEVADYLLGTVRADRAKQVAVSPTADARAYLKNWWLFGKPRPELRSALAGLGRFIATVDTARHRMFGFLDPLVVCDDGIVIVALNDFSMFGILQATLHTSWVLRVGGWLGVGNDSRYNKSRVFDPFPFPASTPEQAEAIGAIAERLDATRRAALAEDERLTMTGLYNLVAAIRNGTLDPKDEAKAVRARARIVAKLHDDLDAAVAAAYGWEWPLAADEIVARLVALNAERAAEEAAGHVRWLRPDYQIPRFGAAKPANAR